VDHDDDGGGEVVDHDDDGGGDGRDRVEDHDGDDGLRFLSICNGRDASDRIDPKDSHIPTKVCQLCSFQDNIYSLSWQRQKSRICRDGDARESVAV